MNPQKLSSVGYSGLTYHAQVTSKDAAKKFVFWLLGSFLILAPMSVSGYATQQGWEWLKWGRVGLLIILGVTCLRWFRFPQGNVISGRLLLFGVFYTLAAAWSTSPAWGLLFKGMYLATIVVGVSLSGALQSEADFRLFSRIMTSIGFIAILMLVLWSANESQAGNQLFWNGRIQLVRLNPNLLAQSAAVFVLLSGFHLVVKDSKNWSITAFLVIILMVTLILLSGSRGAFLVVTTGILSLLPALRRSFRIALFTGFMIALLLLFFGQLLPDSEQSIYDPSDASEIELRITEELTKDTRLKMWQSILNRSLREPFFGIGWMQYNDRWTTTQSAFLQVLLESGLVGTLLYVSFVYLCLSRIFKFFKQRKIISGFYRTRLFVFGAISVAMIFHGVFESSGVTGASPLSLILALSCGQLDQLFESFRIPTNVRQLRG